MPRVNTDEILREFGDWRNMADVMAAGKIAVKKIAKYFDEDITFNQETTLCGKSILNNIAKAKKRGYFIELHYIGVENVDIAKERVVARIKQGGHGIAEQDIEKRYIDGKPTDKFVCGFFYEMDCDILILNSERMEE